MINIGSDNGFLPDSTKPLFEPMLTYLLCGIHLKVILQDVPINLIHICLEIEFWIRQHIFQRPAIKMAPILHNTYSNTLPLIKYVWILIKMLVKCVAW